MSGETETGEISQKRIEHHRIEWTIKNFFSYTTPGERLHSPKFFFVGSEWHLELYPDGWSNDSEGWMYMFLEGGKSIKPKTVVNYRFGLKNKDGIVTTIDDELNHWSTAVWFARTDLLKRKSDLAPSDSLTVTCSFRMNDAKSEFSGLEKLSDDLKSMFLSRKGCDATLKVQNEEFPINRSIVAARSPVFDAMFEADMQEKNTGVVNIMDCHAGAFNDFLAYIYSGKFECTSDEIFELYTIAHKYDVELLKSECVTFTMANLTAENVVDAYAIGHRFDEKELKEECQEFFIENFNEIISNSKWESLLKEKSTFVNMLLKNMAKNAEIKLKDTETDPFFDYLYD